MLIKGRDNQVSLGQHKLLVAIVVVKRAAVWILNWISTNWSFVIICLPVKHIMIFLKLDRLQLLVNVNENWLFFVFAISFELLNALVLHKSLFMSS